MSNRHRLPVRRPGRTITPRAGGMPRSPFPPQRAGLALSVGHRARRSPSSGHVDWPGCLAIPSTMKRTAAGHQVVCVGRPQQKHNLGYVPTKSFSYASMTSSIRLQRRTCSVADR